MVRPETRPTVNAASSRKTRQDEAKITIVGIGTIQILESRLYNNERLRLARTCVPYREGKTQVRPKYSRSSKRMPPSKLCSLHSTDMCLESYIVKDKTSS